MIISAAHAPAPSATRCHAACCRYALLTLELRHIFMPFIRHDALRYAAIITQLRCLVAGFMLDAATLS